VLHHPLSSPFSVSLPPMEVIPLRSLEASGEGETYAALVTGGYTVKEVDVREGKGQVIRERAGTNRAQEWVWYVDSQGRSQVS
jgi:hypothetical protein